MREKTVSIGGNNYTLSAISAADFLALLEEFKKITPDPVKEMLETAALFTDEDLRKEFIREHQGAAYAAKRSRNSFSSPEFSSWVGSGPGAAKAYAMLFKRHHPHLSEDQAFSLAMEGISEHGSDVFAGLFPGELPNTPQARTS